MTEIVKPTKNWLIIKSLVTILLIGCYAVTYQFEPFNDFYNDLILNVITILSALICALIITRTVLFFAPGEPPRMVWIWYAVALWMWTVAEIIWAIYNMQMREVPDFSSADILWISAYLFFALALSRQFGLVLFDRSYRPVWIGLMILLVTLIVPAVIVLLTEGSLGEYAGYFYPIADFAMGVAALILFIMFRGGVLAWPWLSLLVFTISDSLYAWAIAQNIYGWETGSGLLTLIIDLIYIVAYLFMAWGVFNQYLALRLSTEVPDPSENMKITPKSMF